MIEWASYDRFYQRKTYHGPGSHRVCIAAKTSMIALTDVIDQMFARYIIANLAIIPPALFVPEIALECRCAALVQNLWAYDFLLVLGV